MAGNYSNTAMTYLAVGGFAFAMASNAAFAGTLEDVKARGAVNCGVTTGNPGFSSPNDKGDWDGFDVEFCRAVAGSVFGDATKVNFVPLTSKDRFTALQSGEIDVLSRQTTWSVGREVSLGFLFAGITYYDGQGFLINKKNLADVTSAKNLSGAAVCVLSGTTSELNIADYFRANSMDYTPVVFDTSADATSAFDSGRCDVFSDDQSNLYSVRLGLRSPDDYVVLPEIISKEPLGPAVRQGDDKWFNVVKWTYFALVTAEEFGITQANVEEMKASANPDIKRFLGEEADSTIGADLGLSKDWAVQVIKAVGNYGEMFERTLGQASPLKIERGLNALWTNGGLQYAPPVR